ncbi:MAG: helix-turn-helix domain-containing protein [Coriobacteriia bacterium]|nr:helix-turn-helix domain-containing protein [Coriobacteriia bacterium]
MRWDLTTRQEAIRLFDLGFGYKAAGAQLGCPPATVRKWLYTFKVGGKEALLMREHRVYSQELKIAAVQDFLNEGVSKPEIMEKYGILSRTPLERWIRKYREGGPAALAPKPKGRRRKQVPPVYASREEELEARVQELELELAIQKRINALADESAQRRRSR